MRLVRLLAAWCAFTSAFTPALTPIAGHAQQSSPAAPSAPAPSARQTRNAEKFYVQGVRAMEKGDVDAAEKAFAKASKADPSNHNYDVDLQIARQHSVTKLLQDADKARLLGQNEVARAKLSQALVLDPK